MSEEREYPPGSGQKLHTQWVLGVAKDHLYAFLVDDDHMYAQDAYMPLEDLCNAYIKYRASKGEAARRVAGAEWRKEAPGVFAEMGVYATCCFEEHEYLPNSGQRLNTRWVMGMAPCRDC